MTTILITPVNAGLSYCEGYTDATLVDEMQQNFMQYIQWKKKCVSWFGKYSSVYYIQAAIIAIKFVRREGTNVLQTCLLNN
jgi:hypothetical protein